jgi:pimeloyl-ACP methyl ester carboxylesterase
VAASEEEKTMAETFVLIHGAWHGAWCWAAVANHLHKHGDRAHTVDLPGNVADPCDRAKITLQQYVDCVARFIEDRELRSVVLTGHSMAGLVIPGVAVRIPERIKRVVFVSAMVAEDGKSGFAPDDPAFKPALDLANSRDDKSIPVEPIADQFRQFFMQDATRDLQNYVLSCLCPQPVQPFLEPVNMKAFSATGIPQSYLVCEKDIAPVGISPWHQTYLNRLDDPSVRTVDSAHEVMFTKPVDCAEALYEFARE